MFGAVGGAQAGYNWQSGALVLGAEGDFDWSNLKGSINAQCATCLIVTNASLEHDVDWFGTARARIGYAADGGLAYATGGYAFGRVALKGTATGAGVSASLTQNATPSGWTIGGGAELALGPNWSARLAGGDGMPAGAVGDALDLAPNTLTFHFDRLRDAGLVTVRREGRSMIYAARYETMNALIAYLTDNCCRGRPEQCLPAKNQNPARKTPRPHRAQIAEPVS